MQFHTTTDYVLPAYQYQPLAHDAHEIRLVELTTGSFNDDLEIQIVHVSLNTAITINQRPKLSIKELQQTLPSDQDFVVRVNLEGRYVFFPPGYEGKPSTFRHPDSTFDHNLYERDDHDAECQPAYDALSYTWGVQDRSAMVNVVDGTGSRGSSLVIGTNLATALRYLRSEREHRRLWIDALCINQEDIQERNKEVKRMGEIYTRARKTLIWLGEAEQDTEHAISTLRYFADQTDILIPYSYGVRPGAKHLDWWKPEQELPFDEQTWTAIYRLFQRSWFTRTWVLQECQLSDTRAIVQIGHLVMAWPDMRRAIAVMRNNYLVPAEILSIIVPYSIGFQAKYCRSFSRLLAWTKTRRCTDPRDKIYGILGLANSEFTERITPDYGAPLPQLYRQVFFEYLAITKRLDLLCQCILSQRLESTPSWLPNWSAVAKGPVMDIFSFGSRRYASGNSAAHIRQSDLSVLEVLGIPCARIAYIIHLKKDHSGDEARFRKVISKQSSSVSDLFPQQTHEADFVNMVFATRRRNHSAKMKMPSFESLAKAWQVNDTQRNPASRPCLPLPVEYAQCDDSTHCITPLGTMPGDKIYVILGCELPLVLRPLEDGTNLIIGACLKPDIMNGEAMLGPLPDHWKLGTNDTGLFQDFIDTKTQENVRNDPRLEPLSSEWEELDQEGDNFFEFGTMFRNKITREAQKFDPRLSPERLKARAIKLDWLKIV